MFAERNRSTATKVYRRSFEVHCASEFLVFVLTEDKTIVTTGLQVFLIKHDHRNHIKQLERLRDLIRDGKMTTLPDLVDYCKYRTGGYRDQMCGLELVPTKLERYI